MESMRLCPPTNLGSEKVSQLRANSNAEMVWWFAASREQYRVGGVIQIVDAFESDPVLAQMRLDQWKVLSDPAREQFYWPEPNSLVPPELVDFKELLQAPIPAGGRGEEDEQGKRPILPPPDTFLVLLLWPDDVRYLDLSDNFSQQDIWSEVSQAWDMSSRVP
jgi:hypothetical protein